MQTYTRAVVQTLLCCTCKMGAYCCWLYSYCLLWITQSSNSKPLCSVPQHFIKSIIFRSKSVLALYNLWVNKSDCDSSSRIEYFLCEICLLSLGMLPLISHAYSAPALLSCRSWGFNYYETSCQSDKPFICNQTNFSWKGIWFDNQIMNLKEESLGGS